jgi:hypothetical protein
VLCANVLSAHFIVPYLRVLRMTEEKKYVKDPIPAKAILLGDAFDWAFEEIHAKLEILETLDEFFQRTLKLNRELDESVGVYEDAYLDKAATIFFAHICTPVIYWPTFGILKQEIFFNSVNSSGDRSAAGNCGRYVCPGVWTTLLLTMMRFVTPIL